MDEMSDNEIKTLNEIFARAAKEPEFRNSLLKDASAVLGKYSLSDRSKQLILETLREMQSQ